MSGFPGTCPGSASSTRTSSTRAAVSSRAERPGRPTASCSTSARARFRSRKPVVLVHRGSLLRPARGSIPDNVVVGCLLLIPVTAVLTATAKQRLSDGSDFVFSGGPLVSGELHTGPEPDWSFTNDIVTIELQLEDPPRSRTIWVGEHDGKLYVFSAYMRDSGHGGRAPALPPGSDGAARRTPRSNPPPGP